MEENNQISKSNKIKIIVITALIFLVSIAGISYAYFTIQITGNDTASSMRLRTANMQLIYNDVQIVSGEYATPGWSDTKTLTVTNNGNVTADYIIKFRELVNTVINGELVLSAECSSSSGTCDDLPERAIHSASTEITDAYMYGPISIAPGVTHTYTLTAEFIETGSNQNYNQNKYFNGTLNIGDGTVTDASHFTYTLGSEVTYDINMTTCKNYGISQGATAQQAEDYCNKDSGATFTIEDDLLDGLILPSEYANYGLSNVIIPITITGYSNSTAVRYNINMATCVNYIIDHWECDEGDTVCEQQAEDYCNKDSGATFTIKDDLLDEYILSSEYANYGLSNVVFGEVIAPTDVVIPSTIRNFTVVAIDNNAFQNKGLTSVVIPNSVVTIGAGAFQNNQLTSVVIPSGIMLINSYIFDNNQLTSVSIPNGVLAIGEGAFSDNQLMSVSIPNGVVAVGTIPNGLTSFKAAKGFNSYTYMSNTKNRSTVTTLEASANNTKAKSMVNDDKVAVFTGKGTFENNQLTSVVIPSSITTLYYASFAYNQLTYVRIEGKTSSSQFTTYFPGWGWASGYSNSDIVWAGSGS